MTSIVGYETASQMLLASSKNCWACDISSTATRFPRYRSPGENTQTCLLRYLVLQRLCCSYGFSVQQHANFAAEEIKKNPNALTVRHAVVNPEAIVKCTFQNADLVADFELGSTIELDEAGRVLPALEFFDHLFRNRHGMVSVTDETRNADGGVNRAPPLYGRVDFHEKIARKQRRRDNIDTSCVSSALEIAREVRCKSLPSKVGRRRARCVRVCLYDVPYRLAPRHFADSFRWLMRIRNMSGTSTRSMSKRATAASQVSRGFSRSVMRTASKESDTAS